MKFTIEVEGLMICFTDAGRSSARPKEKRDCTVRALAIVAGVGYEEAHAAMAAAGRRERHGVKLERVIAAKKIPGFTFTKLRFRRRTIQKFIQENPAGKFLCRKRGHAFAILDGVVHDSGTRTRGEIIQDAWKVETVLQKTA